MLFATVLELDRKEIGRIGDPYRHIEFADERTRDINIALSQLRQAGHLTSDVIARTIELGGRDAVRATVNG